MWKDGAPLNLYLLLERSIRRNGKKTLESVKLVLEGEWNLGKKQTHAKNNRKRLKVITLLSKVTLQIGRYLGLWKGSRHTYV